MKFVFLIFPLVSLLLSFQVLACDQSALMSCLKQKGGVTCFYKHSCQQDNYRLEYCQNFDLAVCLKYEGGKACLYNLDECKFVLEDEKKKNTQLQNGIISIQNNNSNQQNDTEQSRTNQLNETSNQNENTVSQDNKACAEQKVKACLKNKGGAACFKRHGCNSPNFKLNICQNFELQNCLKNKGGKACFKTKNDCQVITKKEQIKTPVNPPEQSASSNTGSSNNNTASPSNQNNTSTSLTSQQSSKVLSDSADSSDKTPVVNPNNGQTANNNNDTCDSEKVYQCEKKGGGANCYQKYNCTPLSYQKHFCQNFDVEKCAQFQGGVTCEQIKKNCQVFLSKIEEEQKPQDTQIAQNTNQALSLTPGQIIDSKPIEEPKIVLDQTISVPAKIEDTKDTIKPPKTETTPIVVTKDFCAKFNFLTCLSFKGGEACQKNKEACKSLGLKTADSKQLRSKEEIECQQGITENPKINVLEQVSVKINEGAKDRSSEEAMLAKLRSYGHKVYPINSLTVIAKKGSAIGYRDLVANKCSALLSGTFFGRPYNPVGPYLANNQLTIPDSKTINRGYVAMMSDGSFSVSSMNDPQYNYLNASDRQNARSLFNEHVRQVESDKGAKMVQMLGGGALLVRNGKAVSVSDLKSRQAFDQGIGNLSSAQMRQTNHVVAFTHNGRAYAMMTSSVSGNTLQKDLLEAKVDSAVKFDGGSGCATYVAGRAQNLCPTGGVNPTGLCVK